MRSLLRLATSLALAAALGACSISSMLGGGKAPPTLLTLSCSVIWAPKGTAAGKAKAEALRLAALTMTISLLDSSTEDS